MNKHKWKAGAAFGLTLALTGPALLSADGLSDADVEEIPSSGLTGKQLVDIHCARCHLAPDPSKLPREYWNNVTHWMGSYLGTKDYEMPGTQVQVLPEDPVHDHVYTYILMEEDGYGTFNLAYKAAMPSDPLVSKKDLGLIRDYLVKNARPYTEMLTRRPKAPLLENFQPVIPNLDLEPNGLVYATLVDEAAGRIHVARPTIDLAAFGEQEEGSGQTLSAKRSGPEYGDALMSFDLKTGKRTALLPLKTDPVDIERTATGLRVSTVSDGLAKELELTSNVFDIDGLESDRPIKRMLVNGLHRITQHITSDLNGDGLEDILVSAYGDGVFADAKSVAAIYFQTPEYLKLWSGAPAMIPAGALPGAFREVVLTERAGVIGTGIGDFNKDGKPDVAVQIAQGKQELIVYINNGNESFSEHVIAEYSPSHGGQSMLVRDMDGDGYSEIIAINGDHVGGNIDGPSRHTPRPHHGVRIYRNNGDLSFTETFFYHMPGATKMEIHDADKDGDLDIAMVSMFPDWTIEEPETFVYLENRGNWRFEPYSIATDYFGVWSSVSFGDVNGDSKDDIILGSGNYPLLVPGDWASREVMKGRNGQQPSVMYLLNDN